MCTTHKKHSKKRETLRNANHNKTTRRAGYKKVYDTPPPPPHKKKSWDVGRRSVWKRLKSKHSELKEPYEMLNGAKPLCNNSWAEDGHKKKPQNELVKSERSPTKTTLRRTEP